MVSALMSQPAQMFSSSEKDRIPQSSSTEYGPSDEESIDTPQSFVVTPSGDALPAVWEMCADPLGSVHNIFKPLPGGVTRSQTSKANHLNAAAARRQQRKNYKERQQFFKSSVQTTAAPTHGGLIGWYQSVPLISSVPKVRSSRVRASLLREKLGAKALSHLTTKERVALEAELAAAVKEEEDRQQHLEQHQHARRYVEIYQMDEQNGLSYIDKIPEKKYKKVYGGKGAKISSREQNQKASSTYPLFFSSQDILNNIEEENEEENNDENKEDENDFICDSSGNIHRGRRIFISDTSGAPRPIFVVGPSSLTRTFGSEVRQSERLSSPFEGCSIFDEIIIPPLSLSHCDDLVLIAEDKPCGGRIYPGARCIISSPGKVEGENEVLLSVARPASWWGLPISRRIAAIYGASLARTPLLTGPSPKASRFIGWYPSPPPERNNPPIEVLEIHGEHYYRVMLLGDRKNEVLLSYQTGHPQDLMIVFLSSGGGESSVRPYVVSTTKHHQVTAPDVLIVNEKGVVSPGILIYSFPQVQGESGVVARIADIVSPVDIVERKQFQGISWKGSALPSSNRTIQDEEVKLLGWKVRLAIC